MSKSLITLFLLLTFLSVTSLGQTKQDCLDFEGGILDRQVCNTKIRWKDSHILWLLPDVFYSTNVPAGISVNFYKADEDELLNDFTPNSFVLRDILNKVITVQPQYFWKEENGVVNIYPLEDYSILRTTIKTFSIENSTKGEAIGKLLETAEFKHYLESKNLREQDTIIHGGVSTKTPKRYSFTLKNATVREILNEIVRRDGNSTWIYQEYDTKNENEITHIYKLS